MIRNSFCVSAAALVGLVLLLMNRLDFLAGAKKALLEHCGGSIALFLAAFAANVFSATLAINRKIFLKDTGRKLSHFDNQIHAGDAGELPPFFAEKR